LSEDDQGNEKILGTADEREIISVGQWSFGGVRMTGKAVGGDIGKYHLGHVYSSCNLS
jgi:hypothetical protein